MKYLFTYHTSIKCVWFQQATYSKVNLIKTRSDPRCDKTAVVRVRDDVGPSLPALHSLQGLSCECNEQKCQVSGRDNSPAKGLHGAFDIRKVFEIQKLYSENQSVSVILHVTYTFQVPWTSLFLTLTRFQSHRVRKAHRKWVRRGFAAAPMKCSTNDVLNFKCGQTWLRYGLSPEGAWWSVLCSLRSVLKGRDGVTEPTLLDSVRPSLGQYVRTASSPCT